MISGNTSLQLFMLINPESLLGYPYLAVDFTSFRVISFAPDYVDLSTYSDREMEMIEKDYLPTSRFLEADLDSMDDVVTNMVKPGPYDVTAFVDGTGRCVLKFKGVREDGLEEIEFYSNSVSGKEALVSSVFIAELHRLREEAYAENDFA